MPGTAPDLTLPPTTGSSPQASSKSSAPIDAPSASQAAKALASRRESTALEEASEKVRQALQAGEVGVKGKGTVSSATEAAQQKSEEDAVKLKEFVQDDRHFSLVRNFRLADIVTLGNGFCGALSLFSSANFLITHDEKYLWHALFYPLAGMIFDALDGKVARWRRESSMLGQELDSLADSISFGVAPAFLAFVLGLRTPVDTLLLLVFICSGIARLARFNATVALVPKDATGKSKYFEGLPIPSSLMLVAVMAGCVKQGRVELAVPGKALGVGNGLPYGLVGPLKEIFGVEVHWAAVLFGGWAAAMISKTLRIPKF